MRCRTRGLAFDLMSLQASDRLSTSFHLRRDQLIAGMSEIAQLFRLPLSEIGHEKLPIWYLRVTGKFLALFITKYRRM